MAAKRDRKTVMIQRSNKSFDLRLQSQISPKCENWKVHPTRYVRYESYSVLPNSNVHTYTTSSLFPNDIPWLKYLQYRSCLPRTSSLWTTPKLFSCRSSAAQILLLAVGSDVSSQASAMLGVRRRAAIQHFAMICQVRTEHEKLPWKQNKIIHFYTLDSTQACLSVLYETHIHAYSKTKIIIVSH